MISLIHGAKGTGKTKRIMEAANDSVEKVDGSVIYLTDNAKHSREVKHSIRFVDVNDYQIKGAKSVISFIKGLLAGDNDVEKVYIDGLARMCEKDVEQIEQELYELEKLSHSRKVDFVLTISSGCLPEFYHKYI